MAPVLATVTGPLDGVFSIQPGHCNLVGPPTGSYVELEEHGIPVPNPSSPCPLTSSFYTPLKTGTVGLVSGAYQLEPVPTFNRSGGSEANAIVTPVSFLGVGFGLATTCADQQHHGTPTGACPPGTTGFPVPQLSAEPLGAGGCKPSLTNVTGLIDLCLYGNLEGLNVTYNGTPEGTCADAGGNGCYDVGAASGPSLAATSCGSAPLGGCSLAGTLDPLTDAYTLQVTSTIVGTSFNGAKAVFVLAGTYRPGIPSRLTSSTGPGTGASPTSTNPSSGSAGAHAAPGVSGREMDGTFHISAGACDGSSAPTGSWVQLGLGGSPVKNPSSSCDGGAYTPIAQGSVGLETGVFQPDPTPTFDSAGNSLANAIIMPTKFLGTDFGAATDPENMQDDPTGPDVYPAPAAVLSGSTIHANLSAVNFTYNGPANGTCASGAGDGCYQVGLADVVGSYDAATQAYVLSWTATIHGGAFNNATASFHLAGVFSGTIAATASSLTTFGASAPTSGAAGVTPTPVTTPASTTEVSSQQASGPLADAMLGTFHISAGACDGSSAPTGSWVQLGKGGSPIPNPSSSCDGGAYTPIAQGSVGLETGVFQPDPTPTFDSAGNSLANAIIMPTKFLGTDFGAATDPENMQDDPTGPAVFPVPTAVLGPGGSTFEANLSALNFTYNGPPGGTCASGGGAGCYAVGSAQVPGTYDAATGAYTMAWTATIVGGAFNGATASFHLTGTFVGRIVTVPVSAAPSSPSSSTAAEHAASGGGSVPSPAIQPAPAVATAAVAARGAWPTVVGALVLALAAGILAVTAVDGRRRRRKVGVPGPPGGG